MRNLAVATGVAAGLSAGVLASPGPASAAPSGTGTADETITRLEAQGNRVIVDRLSDAPLTEASVVSMKPGAELREWVWDADADDSHLAAVGQVVYVAVR
ncbi:hypothetical protein JDV09_08990 [Mycobacterium sp. Y57]|nr:hypothetical protein [Mycolicibacterium xanthum]MBX7432242.1 hypothetical protein [Mycolicibacterium xanthum]